MKVITTRPPLLPTSIADIPDWVAKIYFRHGLFCCQTPLPMLLLAVIGTFWACYPLFTIQVYSVAKIWTATAGADGSVPSEPPRWLEKEPMAYVQQIIMKAAVHPYTDEMLRNDAFRGPLASAFKLHLSDVSGFFDRETGLDMDHECLRTDGLSPRYKPSLSHLLPDYGCLVLSPANLWRKDPTNYQEDGDILSTVFSYQRSREAHSSLADIMFGLRQRDTGLTKYPVRNRQRTITYSVTVVLRQNKPQFITSLSSHLRSLYPLHSADQVSQDTTHIYFPEQINGAEYLPFAMTIIGVFIYVYFSCNKIELVRSKAGIALSAVVTILSSLFMSVGLTGLSIGGNGYTFMVPYLVAFLGLENILIATKGVVNTPAHMDNKIRVAQGLSKEGWNIVKNIFIEITVLTMGIALGILDSAIQEFCLLAVMGLLTDFFLQTFFFHPCLALDVVRTDLVDEVNKPNHQKTLFQFPVAGPGFKISNAGQEGTGLIAPNPNTPVPQIVPKRVKLVNFWTQQRVVSRFFIITMVGWITMFIYQTGLVENMFRQAGWLPARETVDIDLSNLENSTGLPVSPLHGALMSALNKKTAENLSKIISGAQSNDGGRKSDSLQRLKHKETNYWKQLPYSHWPMLFGLYNMSVYGKQLTLLPPICLSLVISPEAVVKLRSPNESSLENMKTTFEPGDDEDIEDVPDMIDDGPELSPFVPTSTHEVFLGIFLAIPSLIVIIYVGYTCYRLVCNRNYAEWRTSGIENQEDNYTQIIQETAPLTLSGHKQEIESILTDGHIVLSHCLGGRLAVWDSLAGQNLSTIDREEYFNKALRSHQEDHVSTPPTIPEEDVAVLHQLPKQPKSAVTNFPSLCKSSSSLGLKNRKDLFDFKNLVRRFSEEESEVSPSPPPLLLEASQAATPVIWSLDIAERLVVVGCDTGRIEVWDADSGGFRCAYDDGRCAAACQVRLVAGRLVVARLDGQIDFLELVTGASGHQGATATPRRSRMRSMSSMSADNDSICSWGEDLRLQWRHSAKAHAQPITCLALQGGRLVTGSQDHTVRVFRLEDGVGVYTLHGHCGPITEVFIDKQNHSTAGSASMDGMLCVWDLLTGACMYSIHAHDGAILSLTYSPSYVVSLGTDGKLCIWERFQGHLINSASTVEEDSTTYYMTEEEYGDSSQDPNSNLKNLTARLANRCHGSADTAEQSDNHNMEEDQVINDPYVVFDEETNVEEEIIYEEVEKEGVAAYCDVRCEDVLITSSLEEVGSADDEALQDFNPIIVMSESQTNSPGNHSTLYQCSMCPKVFYQRNYWKNHIKSHSAARPFKCGTCEKSFKKVGDMERHEKLCQLEDSKPFKCEQCGKKFSLSNSLSNHIKMHSDKKPYSCQHCSMGFKKIGSKNSHERICVSGELPYACAVCNRKFSAANNLANHVLVHAGVVNILSCSVCGKSFKKPGSHKAHEAKCKEGVSHTCKICSKEFASDYFMMRHLKTHEDSSVKEFQCEECGKSFTHQNGFTNHLKSHLGSQNECKYPSCGLTFASVKELKEHIRSHKSENKNHDCDICGRHFSDSWNCKRHRQTHNPLKPFVCPLCERKFTNQKDMESHSATHTGEKLWKCSACSSSFTHLRGLQGHMNIHTDKAKACDLGCGKVFPTQSSMNQHLLKCKFNKEISVAKTKKLGKWAYEPLKVTGISERGPGASKVVFRCKLCDELFDNYASVQNHIQTHKSSKDAIGEIKDEVVISIEFIEEGLKTEEGNENDSQNSVQDCLYVFGHDPGKDEMSFKKDDVNSSDFSEDASDEDLGETLDTVIVVEDI